MKKIVLFLLTALFTLTANAQKLEKPKIDKITGDTTLETKSETLYNKFSLVLDYLSVSTSKVLNRYFLDFKVMKGISIVFTTDKGDKAIFKLADGKLIEVYTINSSVSSFTSSAGGVSQSYISYLLTNDDITALKSQKIAVIRIITSKGQFDYELASGKADIIQKQLNLITGK